MEIYLDRWDEFYNRAQVDGRLGPPHLSLYMALRYSFLKEGVSVLRLQRDVIMRLSLIRSRATYSKCLRDLHECGYIIYEPSCNVKRGSRVHLKF